MGSGRESRESCEGRGPRSLGDTAGCGWSRGRMCGEAGDVPMAGVTAGARSKAGRTEGVLSVESNHSREGKAQCDGSLESPRPRGVGVRGQLPNALSNSDRRPQGGDLTQKEVPSPPGLV